MLALADGREVAQLAALGEQRHLGVAHPERRELGELLAQFERRHRLRRQDRVDVRDGPQVFLHEMLLRVCGERARELLDVLRPDGEPGRRAVATEALERVGAGSEAAVQVERRHRAARPLPELLTSGDHHDRTVEALDEP